MSVTESSKDRNVKCCMVSERSAAGEFWRLKCESELSEGLRE